MLEGLFMRRAQGHGQLMCKMEWDKSHITTSCRWDDNGGWLDPELCAKATRDDVEYTRFHTVCTRVPRERRTCERRGKHPSRQDG